MPNPRQSRFPQRDTTRVNHRIRVPEVRLIDVDGTQIGIVDTREALRRAQEKNLDLVEVAAAARPPVCRIMDYGKFKYEQGKKDRSSKKSGSKVKEIKFHANVGEHDYQTKLRRAHEFLDEGHRVKCSLYFRGRENDHREFGYDIMNRVMKDCEGIGAVEQLPRMVGRNLVMMISPSRSKTSAKAKKQSDSAEQSPMPS